MDPRMDPYEVPTPQIRHRRSERPREEPAAPAQAPDPGSEGISRSVHSRSDISRRAVGEHSRRGIRPAPRRVPVWMTAAVIALLMCSLALFTSGQLMEAYLKRTAEEKTRVYQSLRDSHPRGDDETRAWIEQYAQEYNLQPAFVASIILNESSYRPTAESAVGARGLMQLMEDTAAWINDQYLRIPGYSFQMMWDPETNIRFGCWYLGYLSRRFRGDPVSVIAAYHAGQGTVDRWLSTVSADGRSLEVSAIPAGDTREYARKVTRDYAIYDALFYRAYNAGDSAVRDPDADVNAEPADR